MEYSVETFVISATDSAGTSTQNVSIGPCASFKCTSPGPSSAIVDEPFAATATFDANQGNSGPKPNPSDAVISYIIQQNGNTVYSSMLKPVYNNQDNTIDGTSSSPITLSQTNTYTITASLTYNGTAEGSCSNQLQVFVEPYMQVYGGDTLTGGTIGTCTSIVGNTNVAQIVGQSFYDTAYHDVRTNVTGPAQLGAGGTLANLALGDIDGFPSDSSLGTGSTAGSTLSMANTTHTNGISQFGGDFQTNAPCVYDYYANRPSSDVTLSNATSIDLASLGKANSYMNYSVTGPVTLNASGPITNQFSIYVNGDVTISTSVTYANSGWNGTIPFVQIVSNGNINIDHNVSELDGLYFADKTIYTCGDGAVGSATYYTTCDSALHVYGSFIANTVDFERTLGNVADATPFTSLTSTQVPETLNGPTNAQWNHYGMATINDSTQTATLTPINSGSPNYDNVGAVYTSTALPSVDLRSITFTLNMYGGNGADGVGLWFSSVPGTAGYDGCALGNSGTETGITFDTFRNWSGDGFPASNDPSSNFISAVNPDNTGVSNNPSSCYTHAISYDQSIPALRNNASNPENVTVTFNNTGAITQVCINGSSCMSTNLQLPGTVYIGLAGSTGGLYDNHTISNVVIHYMGNVNSVNYNDSCSSPDPQAAETFCYDPMIWLASPSSSKIQSPSSITSLPPIL